MLSFKNYHNQLRLGHCKTEILDDDAQSLSCASMNNQRKIENCDSFLDNSNCKTTVPQLSEYFSWLCFGQNYHIIQEGIPVVWPWKKVIHLPPSHGQTFLSTLDEYTQVPTNTITKPRSTLSLFLLLSPISLHTYIPILATVLG